MTFGFVGYLIFAFSTSSADVANFCSFHGMELYHHYIAPEIKKSIEDGAFISHLRDKRIIKYKQLNQDDPFSMNPIINEDKIKLKDIVHVMDIKYCAKYPFLIGQRGLFAKKQIAADAALGAYVGDMYTINDYTKHHDCSANDLNEFSNKSQTIIIAPNTDDMILRFINDSRISATDLNIDGLNVGFNQTSFKKIPCVILYTTKMIKKHHQLFMPYGNNYWH